MSEVFSPGIHTPLKDAVGVAGQGLSESSATSGAALDAGSRLVAFDASLAEGPDLRRCLSQTSADGGSW